jgi:outer membrane protein insertion porin family
MVAKSSKRISEIRVEGLKNVPTAIILQALPYTVGGSFDPDDKTTSRQALENIYNTGRVDTAKIEAEDSDDTNVVLYIVVAEKARLKDISIEGNKHVSNREIYKKLPFNDIQTINNRDLRIYAQQIKELFIEKGYLNAVIDTELRTNADDTVNAYFKVQEGYRTLVTRIDFVGNCAFSAKELRAVTITKEDWLLSILDHSGTYHPEKIEADKYMLEQFYHNHGYINAKIPKVDVVTDKYNKRMQLVYHVVEGDQYRIGTIKTVGNEELDEAFLTSVTPLRTGMIYSKEAVNHAMKAVEQLWGDRGYIFARVHPMIVPNPATKTMDITLTSDIGNKITLRKVTIKGNNKTRDKVIRRLLTVQEGNMITKRLMQSSQRNVSALGYFEPKDGVNWKIIKRTEDTADLDLIVKEAKTGHFGFNIGYGAKGGKDSKKEDDQKDQPEDKTDKSDLWDLTEGVSATIEFSDTNLMGYGTRVSASGSFAKDNKSFVFNISQPWLFDKPITGGINFYHKRPSYTQLHQLRNGTINERLTGGALTVGYVTPTNWMILNNFHLSASLGIDGLRYAQRPLARIFPNDLPATDFYQNILKKEFNPGEYLWLGLNADQDMRNHPVHTSYGHAIHIGARIGMSGFDNMRGRPKIGYYTLDAQADWYTPLIGDYDLIFHIRGYVGWAQPIGNHTIPFGRLFHIGGDTTVRGYTYGQIGPTFNGDSIGGTKGFFVNTELIFPINPSMTMKGVLFYDGGAGWDNPYVGNPAPPTVRNNNFDYRHAIGVGLRLLQPMPIRIDWGFKIDPRRNESSYEVHFSTTYDW